MTSLARRKLELEREDLAIALEQDFRRTHKKLFVVRCEQIAEQMQKIMPDFDVRSQSAALAGRSYEVIVDAVAGPDRNRRAIDNFRCRLKPDGLWINLI